MVYDHMMYFGDKTLLREHLPHIDRVLGFFHKHLTKEGYVGKVGGRNGRDRFWSFVDWTPEWKETSGIPPAVQVFAVLTGTTEGEQGKRALLETIAKKEAYPQCSVAMAFYLFRVMEMTGLYEYSKEYWGIWRRMLAKHSTTCIEDEVQERSDCHTWGALILYELPSVILGVRPGEPGYKSILIKPCPGYLKEAEGTVVTPGGMIYVHWHKEESGELLLDYQGPENVSVVR